MRYPAATRAKVIVILKKMSMSSVGIKSIRNAVKNKIISKDSDIKFIAWICWSNVVAFVSLEPIKKAIITTKAELK